MRQEEAFIGQKVRAMGTSTMGTPGDGRIGEIDEIFERGTASVDLPDGNRNVFWLEDLESVVEMKIGDRVKVMRAWEKGEFPDSSRMNANGEMQPYIGKVGKCVRESWRGTWRVKFPDGVTWAYPEQVLLKVNSKSACILTEKVMVGDVKCRKITGFEGILGREELPKMYVEGKPNFYLVPKGEAYWNIRHFDGKELALKGCASSVECIDFSYTGLPNIEMYGRSDVLNVGDIIPETTFQNILTWLKRAGSRLAKIRKQEQDAWSGREEVSI